MKKKTIALLLALVLLSTMSLVACGSTVTRTNTFSVGSSPAVEVGVGSGKVNLVLGTTGQIVVVAELHKPEGVEYKVSQDGDSIIVDADTKSGSNAYVTLTVPENTSFTLSTGSGSVDVPALQASGQVNSGSGSLSLEKTTGDVEISTSSGYINLSGVSGSFNVNAASGNITLRDSTGTFNVNTASGNITLRDSTGTFNVNTASGNITLRNSTGSFSVNSASGNFNVRESKGTFNMSSASGFIEFQGELAQGSDNKLSSASGSVTVEFSGSPSVELDLEIKDGGRLRVDLPLTVSEQSEYRLIGTIGDGEASLNVSTGSGNITIK